MPILSGYPNICNFIACTAHGMIIGPIPKTKGIKLLYAALVAYATVRRRPAPKIATT